MQKIIFLALFLLFSSQIFAQKSKDSLARADEKIEIRAFDQQKIEEFRKDSDFRYTQELIKEPSLLDRIWAWFVRKLFGILGTEEGWTVFKIILYIFAGVAAIYVILKLLGVNVAGLLRKESQKNMPDYMIEADNIHDIDFGKRIETAINSQDYRNAIRLLYLFALRQLSEKDLIKWKLNKTNQEYWKELKTKGLGEGFSEITYFFEWVWYGHFEIDRRKFEEVQGIFQKFEQKLVSMRS